MINFSNEKLNMFRYYDGANGSKIGIVYNGKNYMLKFNYAKGMVYRNNYISEHLGCEIFKELGVESQNTILGTYQIADKMRNVVACEDFIGEGEKLVQFAMLKNSIVDSSENGYGTELSEIIDTIEEQQLIPQDKLTEYFWDMFIVDALIGNFDRHNGNWGFIVNENKSTVRLSPVYDCGSAFYPQMPEDDMLRIMADENEVNNRIYVFPTSAIKQDGVKINYFDFISSLTNKDCNKALKKMAQRMNNSRLKAIIDNADGLSDVQKQFYKFMIIERKKKIIDFSFEKLKAI
ncbi:MAG: HipA domain-containing protein [Bacillota bacterium]